jgi:hypothetical protein
MWSFVVCICGTFGLFVIGPLSGDVTNWPELVIFLSASLGAFVVGFAFVALTTLLSRKTLMVESIDTFPRDRRLIRLSILWYILFSVLSLVSHGITTPEALVDAILNPRDSYYAKFDAIPGGGSSIWIFQILNLSGALYFVLIPLAALHWNRLSSRLRIGVVIAVLSYLGFFLATGTQKGLGDILVAIVTVLLAITFVRPRSSVRRKRPWKALTFLSTAVVLPVAIVSSFGARTDSTSTLFQSADLSRAVAQLSPLFGDDFSRGLVVLSSYASHGYLGLSYALQLPFEWAGGLGAFRGISSYLPQYFGIEDPYLTTYPVRIEQVYSWSATELWSTVYPWMASDITFPGVVLAMLVLGICVATVWMHFLRERSSFSLVLMVIFAIFVVYSPANNQLFNDRYSAIGVITLLIVYGFDRWTRRTQREYASLGKLPSGRLPV